VDAALIAFAIPIFFGLIGVEHVLAKRRREKVYVFADSIADLSCGISEQVLSGWMTLLFLAPYAWLEHVAPWHLPTNAWWTWVLGFVLVDHSYYWFHRFSHRVNFLWAQHKVHHQSEEYNLAVALRQEILGELGGGFLFYLPLALLGVPLSVFVVGKTLDTLYQFWIHTRLVKKLPAPIEWIMNTPSHHRVHHGINPEYIDKNYAGVFIVWDRMFGTFVPEEREPAYGTVVPLRSFDAVWANVEPFVELCVEASRTKRWVDKLRVFVAPPEWRPADLGGTVTIPEVSRETQTKYAVSTPPGVPRLVRAELAVVGIVVGALLLFRDDVGPWRALPVAAWVLAATSLWAALLRGAPRARVLAAVHGALVPVVALVAIPHGAAYLPCVVAALVVGVGLAAWAAALPGATPQEPDPFLAGNNHRGT